MEKSKEEKLKEDIVNSKSIKNYYNKQLVNYNNKMMKESKTNE